MGSDKQRLVALEALACEQSAALFGFVLSLLLWSLLLPLEPVLLGSGIVFLVSTAWSFGRYMEAKHQ